MDAAAQQQETDHRMIDLLVCKRQGFAVINVIGRVLPAQSEHGRRHNYELKVARRVVQKYNGTMSPSCVVPCLRLRLCCRPPKPNNPNDAYAFVHIVQKYRRFEHRNTEFHARNTTFSQTCCHKINSSV